MSNLTCYLIDGIPGSSTEVTDPIPIACNNVVGSVNTYTGAVEYSQYGYNQLPWAVYLFITLNAIGLASHIGLGVYWKTWWLLPTMAAGTAVELIGWCGRYWSLDAEKWTPNNGGLWESEYGGFLMQIVCLVVAPTFFSAANYVLLNRLVRVTGGRLSMVTPDSFTVVFIVADVLCIVIQGAGGGIAGSAGNRDGANTGAYVMTGGVCLQLLVTVLFCVLYVEFLYRYLNGRPAQKQYDLVQPFRWLKCCGQRKLNRNVVETYPASIEEGGSKDEIALPNLQDRSISRPSSGNVVGYIGGVSAYRVLAMSLVLGFATLLITIRGVYRAVELTDGWRGPIAVNQPLFLGMDALLMILLVFSYIAYHPGLVLGRRR